MPPSWPSLRSGKSSRGRATLWLKVLRESMTAQSRVYTATAVLTEEGLEFLEERADEFGGG
jgi:hypothetical protein